MANIDPIDITVHRRARNLEAKMQKDLTSEAKDQNRELAEMLAGVIKQWLEEDERVRL